MVQTTKEVQMVQSCKCSNCLRPFLADPDDTKPRCPRCGLSICHCTLTEFTPKKLKESEDLIE